MFPLRQWKIDGPQAGTVAGATVPGDFVHFAHRVTFFAHGVALFAQRVILEQIFMSPIHIVNIEMHEII